MSNKPSFKKGGKGKGNWGSDMDDVEYPIGVRFEDAHFSKASSVNSEETE